LSGSENFICDRQDYSIRSFISSQWRGDVTGFRAFNHNTNKIILNKLNTILDFGRL